MELEKLSQLSLVFIGICLFVLILKEFQSFLRPFVIAIILSFLFVPITRFSKERKIHILVISTVIIVILSLIIAFFGGLFAQESSQIQTGEETINKQVDQILQLPLLSFGGKLIDLNAFIDPGKIGELTSKGITILFSSTTTFFSELFLIVLFLLFILPSHDLVIKRISSKMKNKDKKNFLTSLQEIEESIRAYLSTKSIVSLGTAITSGIIMLIFGVNFVFIFMTLIFILNFIPNIGSFIAVLVVLISYLFDSGFGTSLVVLGILLIIVQIIFGNIIEPKFAGRQLELSPVIILLSLFFWGSIWGIGGMLFAVPLTSILKIVLNKGKATKTAAAYLS